MLSGQPLTVDERGWRGFDAEFIVGALAHPDDLVERALSARH
jgi:hypothetical protein